jgi:hypothetical protein
MSSDVEVRVQRLNGRSPKRVVRLSHGDAEYVDTIDPMSGFERGKLLDRAAQRLGIPRHRLGWGDAAIVAKAEEVDEPETIEYPALTAAELDGEQYAVEYIIPGILAQGQHAVGGGPHKALKTLILACDLGLSAAVGGHFLGYFALSRPYRTAIMSGECGYPVIQENLRRIARAAGTELRYVGNLLVSESLPKFGHLDHADAMGRFIADNGLELVVLDPAYLCFDGLDATNVFVMGGLLRSMAEVFVEHGATMLLLHHSTKTAGVDGQPIELADLSFAGFREFAAQWLLLSRYARYLPGSGHHELLLSVGGRAGHSGHWALQIDEGEYQHGVEREWAVKVLRPDEAKAACRDAAADAKEARRQSQLEADMAKVVKRLLAHPDGETAKTLRMECGLNPQRFDPAIAALIDLGDVQVTKITKSNRKTPYDGFRLREMVTTNE